jgi:glucose 1-dehydrogenase
MNSQQLQGEIAVVTGSDSGIGQATALAFAKEGADVAVTYLHDKEGAERTQREIEAAGRKTFAVRLDVRDRDP